jgi:hypothetical protein
MVSVCMCWCVCVCVSFQLFSFIKSVGFLTVPGRTFRALILTFRSLWYLRKCCETPSVPPLVIGMMLLHCAWPSTWHVPVRLWTLSDSHGINDVVSHQHTHEKQKHYIFSWCPSWDRHLLLFCVCVSVQTHTPTWNIQTHLTKLLLTRYVTTVLIIKPVSLTLFPSCLMLLEPLLPLWAFAHFIFAGSSPIFSCFSASGIQFA